MGAHDAVQGPVVALHKVGLRVVGWSGGLADLQPVAQLVPDRVVELSSLVRVDPHRASKLGDPGLQQRVGHRASLLVRYRSC